MITTKVGPELEIDYPPNSAVVRATDMRNPAHWGSADVLLSPIEEILFARSHREAEIDTNLDLFLTMLAEVKEGKGHSSSAGFLLLEFQNFILLWLQK